MGRQIPQKRTPFLLEHLEHPGVLLPAARCSKLPSYPRLHGDNSMLLEFYHLRQQPFGVTPDPAYLYLARTHRDALTALLTGIKEARGFFGLIAEPGMGK